VKLVGLSLVFALCSCRLPAPSHAFVVRDVASKCALIAFRGCADSKRSELRPGSIGSSRKVRESQALR
jgi:hypothetical protein